MPTIQEMTERPLIYDTDPLVEQIKDLHFYFDWLNKAGFQPNQADWDYYREHLHRIEPLESAWRAKRRDHMIMKARLFLEWVNPLHADIDRKAPDISVELFNFLSIYDAACEFYVSMEIGKWTESQAVAAENKIRLFIKEHTGA